MGTPINREDNRSGLGLILAGEVDPSVTAVQAPKGAVYIQNNSQYGAFQKTDEGTTNNWEPLGQGAVNKLLQERPGLALIYSGNNDPRLTAVDAPRGALFLQGNGQYGLFQKQDNGLSTNWEKIGNSIAAEFFDEHLNSVNSQLGWTVSNTGSGLVGSFNGQSNRPGQWECRVATNVNSRASVGLAANGMVPGSSFVSVVFGGRLDALVNPGVNEFFWSSGLFSGVNFASAAAVGFQYDFSLSPNWLGFTRNASIQTLVNSGIPAQSGTNFNFRFDIAPSWNQVDFYIAAENVASWTFIGSSNSTIPVSSQTLGLRHVIERISSPASINTRWIPDYTYMKIVPVIPRGPFL